jgi:hypothetical protein
MEGVFETMNKIGAAGFVFYPVPMLDSRVGQLAEMAIQRRLLWSDEIPRNAVLGALLSHGPDYVDLSRRAAGYVDRILALRADRAVSAGLAVAVIDLLQAAHQWRRIGMKMLTRWAEKAVAGRVIAKLIFPE